MSTIEDKEAEAKKTVFRRRPAGTKPQTLAENSPRVFEAYDPRPTTQHDRYLTYDSRGKLITHTVYHAPLPTKPVVLTFPKSKKYKAPEPAEGLHSEPE